MRDEGSAARWMGRLAGAHVGRREARLVLAVLLGALAVAVVYTLASDGHTLVGDEPEYDFEGRAIAAGHWFFTSAPYGIVHEGLWKAPGYPTFVGVVYSVLGPGVSRLLFLQTLLVPATVFLVWLLGRRLFDPRVALAGAAAATLYPGMWQYQVRMLPDGFALVLALGVMILVLERAPKPPGVLAVGVLMGAGLLVRPTQFFLFALIGVAYMTTAGLARGALALAGCVAVAALCVAPWTLRNHHLTGAFIPISMQDAAAYGTFNPDAARDREHPWSWRETTRRDRDLFAHPLPDAELRRRLLRRATGYIDDHPSSLASAFFWNGLSRTWDIRRPANALFEVNFDGRVRAVATVALVCWWALLAAALVALWRVRARRTLVLPLLAAALAASLVFTSAALSRYRLPLEPPVILLACSVLLGVWDRLRGRSTTACP
jgi:4-amino-4-deoxy-L-arabinose transferase-like glycosyltransferase